MSPSGHPAYDSVATREPARHERLSNKQGQSPVYASGTQGGGESAD